MPFGQDIYKNDGTKYRAGTPAAFGCVEVKLMLERRAAGTIPIPEGFDAHTLTFGKQAEQLCASVQAALGLKADGQCGPSTMREGFKPDLQFAAQRVGMKLETICKLISLESNFNPSAFNPAPWPSSYPNGSRDRGIAQINTQTGVADPIAFNVRAAFEYAAGRLSDAIESQDGDLDVAIASYNVGTLGASYYERGRDYVKLYHQQKC